MEANSGGEKLDLAEDPDEEIIVPDSVKPFLERKITNDLYQELLYDKLDLERVTLSLEDFKTITFPDCDVPRFHIALLSFFTKESEEFIIEMKNIISN